MKRKMILLQVACGLLLPGLAYAQWTDVTPGISYRQMDLPGPVKVFLARADRSKDTWTIDSMTSMGTIKGGRETVPDMAKRYDDTVTSNGRRYEVKVAINGDYFNGGTGYAFGGQIMAGWFVKRYDEANAGSGFFWTSDRRCAIGGYVNDGAKMQRVIFADKSEMGIDKLNNTRKKDELALYTPQYDSNTGTSGDGVEVLVQVSEPVSLMPKPPGVRGKVVKIRQNAGATPLPFDCVVLSATGKAADELLEHAHVGQDLYIHLGIKDIGIENIKPKPADWHNAYGSIGDTQNLMFDGYISKHWEAKAAKYAAAGKKHGSVVKDPRTAIAYNKDFVYFIVIDGRTEESIGMTFTQTAEFCKNELNADNAVMQDGGGSSTLWVDGKVKNVPSDRRKDDKNAKEGKPGVPRAVANGYLIALVHPPKFSKVFEAGRQIKAKGDIELKLGPGTQYGPAGKATAGQAGQILKHALDGVYAKGTNWWPIKFGEVEGWAPEESLTAVK